MFRTLKRHLAIRRLNRIITPNPEYARRRAAQMKGERKERFLEAVKGVL